MRLPEIGRVSGDESPIGAIFMKSHSNCTRHLLLPSMLGTFQPLRKFSRARHTLGYKRCSALRAFQR
jgi:hypothetical protein